jgi:sugar phosphate isomerase/epimerase
LGSALKLAISNIAWTPASDLLVADIMDELGIGGVEIAPTKLWNQPLEATSEEIQSCRQFWETRGKSVVALQALLFGRPDLTIFENEDKRARTLEHLAGMARIGSGLGARILVFGSPMNRRVENLAKDEVQEIAVSFFSAAGESAQRWGTILCIEPNPTVYGCDFVTTSIEGLELVRRVGHPGFGLHLDAAGMWQSQEPIEAALERCAGSISHFHASEPNLMALGKGGVDHARFAAGLRAIQYEGWVSVEMRYDRDLDTPDELRRALTFLVDTYGQKH